jgi:hypothetical protein
MNRRLVGDVAREFSATFIRKVGGSNKLWGFLSRIIAAAIKTYLHRAARLQKQLNPMGG